MGNRVCPVCGKETDSVGYCFHHCHFCFKLLVENEECDCGYEDSIIPAGALEPGTTLDNGRYVLGGVLGKGGFGITYIGFDTNFKAKVAIKEYFPDEFVTRGRGAEHNYVFSKSSSEFYSKFLKKFQREALILKKLERVPNIVKVEDYIEKENNTSYIIMEYVEGKSLKSLLMKKGGKMPWEEFLSLMDPLLVSIAQIHEKRIDDKPLIHRDIAPDNILIDQNGRPVLIDFGIARIGEASNGSIPSGKAGFAPIEQIVGAESQDCRTDIYALGATYYYGLTGKTPDNAKNRVGRDTLLPVNQVVQGVPAYVSNAIMKALAPNIENRWNNVYKFRDALNTKQPDKPESLFEKFKKWFKEAIGY